MKLKRCVLSLAVLVAAAEAVKIRMSNTTKPLVANATNGTSVDLGAILEKAAALSNSQAAPQSEQQSTAVQHGKLDLGLNRFEGDAEQMFLSALTSKLPASNESRQDFNKTVEVAFKAEFDQSMKPIKEKVSKYWVELKDEKRDTFAAEVKKKFDSIFDGQSKEIAKRADSFSAKDLPPGADDAAVKTHIGKVVSSKLKFLTHQMDNYVELYYMSSIFLGYRVKGNKHSAMLALQVSQRTI